MTLTATSNEMSLCLLTAAPRTKFRLKKVKAPKTFALLANFQIKSTHFWSGG